MNYKERVQARSIEFAKATHENNRKYQPSLDEWDKLSPREKLVKSEMQESLAELCIKHEAEAWENGYMERMVEVDKEMTPDRAYYPINVKLQALGYIE